MGCGEKALLLMLDWVEQLPWLHQLQGLLHPQYSCCFHNSFCILVRAEEELQQLCAHLAYQLALEQAAALALFIWIDKQNVVGGVHEEMAEDGFFPEHLAPSTWWCSSGTTVWQVGGLLFEALSRWFPR